ncbi:MAG: hypothetical protein WA957_00620 [Alteraurantiacibacter sp.]
MLDLLLIYKSYAQYALLFATAFAAWRWGAKPEWATTTILVGFLGGGYVLAISLIQTLPKFTTVETIALVFDVVAFALFLAIALFANRIYPLCLTIIQGLAVLSHFAAASVTSAPLAYAILSVTPSYLLMGTLMVGIGLHRQRVKHFGPYRSWRDGRDGLEEIQEKQPI